MSTSNEKMKWIMFWVFLTLFVMAVLGTLGVVFLGFGTPNESERELLVKGLIGEIAACVVALFYSIFGLKKSDTGSVDKINALEIRIEELEQNLILSTKEIESDINFVSSEKGENKDNHRSTFYHDVFPSIAALDKFEKPPAFDQALYKLIPTFSNIKEDINNSKPYDREHKINSYIGLKLQWKCAFSSFRENDDHYRIYVDTDKALHGACLIVDKGEDISRLKILDEYTPMWCCGTISDLSGAIIELTDAKISL